VNSRKSWEFVGLSENSEIDSHEFMFIQVEFIEKEKNSSLAA
jgi:hypothetical protein